MTTFAQSAEERLAALAAFEDAFPITDGDDKPDGAWWSLALFNAGWALYQCGAVVGRAAISGAYEVRGQQDGKLYAVMIGGAPDRWRGLCDDCGHFGPQQLVCPHEIAAWLYERYGTPQKDADTIATLQEAIRQAYAALEQGQTGEAADWLREAMQRHHITPVEQQQEAR